MNNQMRDVYIVAGRRTPFLKAGSAPGQFTSSDLAVACGRQLLLGLDLPTECVDSIVVGCMLPKPEEATIARLIGLRLGLKYESTGLSVQRNCASGLQAIDTAAIDIAIGRHDLILAGGTDAMSHAPLQFPLSMNRWLGGLMASKTLWKKLLHLLKFRPKFIKPEVALLKGLKDAFADMSMGQTAEKLAKEFGITREQMDAYAVMSHERAASADKKGHFQNRIELIGDDGQVYQQDTGVRADSNTEKLAKLKPFFDKPFGHVTAGNSSQITDGAALLLLASSDAVKQYNLPVVAKIVDCSWQGLDPTVMGLGPVDASIDLCKRQQINMDQIDRWEINEAFAAQVLACQMAFNDKSYCQKYFGLEQAFGLLDLSKVNVDGGAIALGHPIGASGARIVLQLIDSLCRDNLKYGIASLCIGGGQGGAMLIEKVAEIAE